MSVANLLLGGGDFRASAAGGNHRWSRWKLGVGIQSCGFAGMASPSVRPIPVVLLLWHDVVPSHLAPGTNPKEMIPPHDPLLSRILTIHANLIPFFPSFCIGHTHPLGLQWARDEHHHACANPPINSQR